MPRGDAHCAWACGEQRGGKGLPAGRNPGTPGSGQPRDGVRALRLRSPLRSVAARPWQWPWGLCGCGPPRGDAGRCRGDVVLWLLLPPLTAAGRGRRVGGGWGERCVARALSLACELLTPLATLSRCLTWRRGITRGRVEGADWRARRDARPLFLRVAAYGTPGHGDGLVAGRAIWSGVLAPACGRGVLAGAYGFSWSLRGTLRLGPEEDALPEACGGRCTRRAFGRRFTGGLWTTLHPWSVGAASCGACE